MPYYAILCLILVYIPFGCIGGSHGQALSWAIRIKVAVGAARGLAFLHEAEKPVIFRDFKTSNILLNSVSSNNSNACTPVHNYNRLFHL